MQKSLLTIIVFICFQLHLLAGSRERALLAEQYIQNFKDDAIKEMRMYNIPASITLAQGMFESAFGTSDLAKYANNHFGIKCHEWEGPVYIKDDDKKDECFRKYSSVLDSYTDHSLFLKSRTRYAQLFELNHTDYVAWAKGLKEAGYATDPKYPKRLIELIELYQLYKYDIIPAQTVSTKKMVPEEPIIRKSEIKEKPVETKKANEKTVVTETIQTHEILRSGIIKYIIIKPNDTFKAIAKETDKDLWQLYKYNDLTPTDKLIVGQKLYLQPKHRKAKEPFHIVKKGDTMQSISQWYCVKLKLLYKRNNMKQGEEPTVGQQLHLRSTKKISMKK